MFVKNRYYYYYKLFSNEFCDNIIKIGNSLMPNYGKIGSKESRMNLKYRKSKVSWIKDKNILHPIMLKMQEANVKAGWNFNLDLNLDLEAQFTKYEKNEFYHWHCDSFMDLQRNRKISFTLNLSDPNDYKGGDFEFDFRDSEKKLKPHIVKEAKEKGSCIIFPSFFFHRVKPVTKGVRYSLVVWLQGDNFK